MIIAVESVIMADEAQLERCMLDTNIFNAIVKGDIERSALDGITIVATRVQQGELARCRDDGLRDALLELFGELVPEPELSAAFAFGIEGAGWGQARWCSDPGKYAAMRDMLRQSDRKARKRADAQNQEKDIQIAYTALDIGATLVTNDRTLAEVMRQFGGRLRSLP